ncbi:MAG TPA: hypothetical protein VGI19_16370 [Candidatus Cybelea sp.]|jgi:hypothetical protein
MLYRGTLGAVIAFALTGCGGGQTPAVPQAVSGGAQSHSSSPTRPHAVRSGDLIYAADGRSDVVVLSYPQGKPVGKLTTTAEPWGLCSDSSGDVFVVEENEIVEYSHGGTSPINTLDFAGGGPGDCSWDSTTGNLAAVSENRDTVSIFPNSQGPAKTYTDYGYNFKFCAYGDKGDLFLSGDHGDSENAVVEFNAGSGTFTPISLNEQLTPWAIQWDGKYLAIEAGSASSSSIYQVQVSGSSGKIVSNTPLNGPHPDEWYMRIQGDKVIMPIWQSLSRHDDKNIAFWSYPAGGKPLRVLSRSDFKAKGPIRGVTISVAPSR